MSGSSAVVGGTLLSIALLSAICAAPARAQDRAQATKLPDLSAYNCGYTAAPPPGYAITALHIGQVIKGRYAEWNEFYLTNAEAPDARKLACVSQMVPTSRQLNADEAKGFLADSLAIGAPSNSVAKAVAATEPVDLEDVKVEPSKRLIQPQADVARAQSTVTEAPPVPVTHSSDSNAPNNAPTVKPNAAVVTDPADTATPQTAGVEDRTPVGNTTAYPNNTVGFLVIRYPNGEQYRCTGTLVSPYTVLTAGHCVHNNTRGGFVTQVAFYPGQYQPQGSSQVVRPYGGHADWQNLKATQRWIQISGSESYPVTDYQNDFAAIQFRTPFTHTATFMPVVFSSTTGPAISVGYPGVVNGASTQTQWTHSGAERSLSLRSYHVREFAIDSSGGNSGGPFWVNDAATGRPTLVGSLSYGDDLNDRAGGPWYDGWNQALLKDWMAFNVSPGVEVPQNSSSGLRVASVFSSVQPQSISYVRLYNPGPTPGTVNITLADYATGTLLTTWTSPTIAAGASAQFAIGELENNGSVPVTNRPPFYSMSIRPTFNGYFQHVLWQRQDGSITDITTCDTKTTSDPNLLLNVHSTAIPPGYPSTVVVQNTGSTPTSVTLGIYDSRNGNRLGLVGTGPIAANAQVMTTMISLQNAVGVTTTPDQFHFNVRAESPFTGYLQHLVRNERSGVISDMTPVCAMTP